MRNRPIIVTLAIVLAFTFITCDNGDDKTHTHDYSATWSKNATQHWHECSCGDKKDVADHQWGEWVETTPATYDTDGLETETCICGATDTRPITKFKTEQTVTIGGGTTIVNITAEYNRTDTTSIVKIENAVALFQTAFNANSANHKATINNLLTANGNYKIVVDYVNDIRIAYSGTTENGFTPTSRQTLIVSKAWFDTNPTFNGNTLRNALDAMLAYEE